MKLIALILLVTGGYFFVQESNDSGSDFGNNVMSTWNDFSSELQSGGGPDCGNYGRPDVSAYANRGGASCTIGRQNVTDSRQSGQLNSAYNSYRQAYQTFVDYQESFGPYASVTIQAQENYYRAKAHYDTLAASSR